MEDVMEKYASEFVHISQIRVGDVVRSLRDGLFHTVCRKDIGNVEILGRTIFGDSWLSGHKPVERIIFPCRLK